MRFLVAILALFWLVQAPSNVRLNAPDPVAGCTATASSLVDTTVESEANALTAGQTLCLPDGTANWDTAITITKGVWIKATNYCTESGGIPTSSCSTIINSTLATTGSLFNLTPASGTVQVSGIKFTCGSGDARPFALNGVRSDSRRFNIHHNYFDAWCGGTAMYIDNEDALGVIHHNYFKFTSNLFAMYSYNRTASGDPTDSYLAWSESIGWGSERFLFMENNTFDRGGLSYYAIVDSCSGAKLVYRYNLIINGWLEAHGTESCGTARGTGAVEAYGNTFEKDASGTTFFVNLRSGMNLTWGNVGNANYAAGSYGAALATYRMLKSYLPFGQADGTSPADINDAGNPFDTRTVTSGADIGGGLFTVTVTGAGWTTNQWQGYVVKKSPCVSYQSPWPSCGGYVVSNTSEVITYASGNSGGEFQFAGGDTLHINKVTHAVDHPGRGEGTAWSYVSISSLTSVGTLATAVYTGADLYANNDWILVDSPIVGTYTGIYQIANVNTGANSFEFTCTTTCGSSPAALAALTKMPGNPGNAQANVPVLGWRNFRNTSVSINGWEIQPDGAVAGTVSLTSAFEVPSGLLSARPGSGTGGNGDWYFATDQGSWNTSCGDGTDGILYLWTGGAWTTYYTPYACPHTLVTP